MNNFEKKDLYKELGGLQFELEDLISDQMEIMKRIEEIRKELGINSDKN